MVKLYFSNQNHYLVVNGNYFNRLEPLQKILHPPKVSRLTMQQTNRPIAVDVLLKSPVFLRTLMDFTSVPQIFCLILTHAVEKNIFCNYIPYCKYRGNGRYVCRRCATEKSWWVQAVSFDSGNAKLSLDRVARHVGSQGIDFAKERDKRRSSALVWCSKFSWAQFSSNTSSSVCARH